MAGECVALSPFFDDGGIYRAYTERRPVGVVGGITPWNFPLGQAIQKLAPAIAFGCTIVLKPSEEASLTTLRLGELILEAGFPAGAVNIVTDYGSEAGQALIEHPLVRKIAFTGSTATGQKILASSAAQMKRVTLELGGKSPARPQARPDQPDGPARQPRTARTRARLYRIRAARRRLGADRRPRARLRRLLCRADRAGRHDAEHASGA